MAAKKSKPRSRKAKAKSASKPKPAAAPKRAVKAKATAKAKPATARKAAVKARAAISGNTAPKKAATRKVTPAKPRPPAPTEPDSTSAAAAAAPAEPSGAKAAPAKLLATMSATGMTFAAAPAPAADCVTADIAASSVDSCELEILGHTVDPDTRCGEVLQSGDSLDKFRACVGRIAGVSNVTCTASTTFRQVADSITCP